ncbi:hypothetical protein CspeluHIS016_0200250 [Cutaneotrichosporon spelunceum]|uniref:Uncharacterized protein n=1 Tax=Cutaneotrichosporon spelunceum TaxID=1672016 RepID=A0AAD3YAQ5_9TREE|nr:hypothetical protein CspeluHIS016_0200250 [Cutaneotrichosporon spelunceum]
MCLTVTMQIAAFMLAVLDKAFEFNGIDFHARANHFDRPPRTSAAWMTATDGHIQAAYGLAVTAANAAQPPLTVLPFDQVQPFVRTALTMNLDNDADDADDIPFSNPPMALDVSHLGRFSAKRTGFVIERLRTHCRRCMKCICEELRYDPVPAPAPAGGKRGLVGTR